MFPAFETPTRHTEITGARRARRAHEQATSRTSSLGKYRDSDTCSVGTTRSISSIFKWGWKKKSEDITEITAVEAAVKKKNRPEPLNKLALRPSEHIAWLAKPLPPSPFTPTFTLSIPPSLPVHYDPPPSPAPTCSLPPLPPSPMTPSLPPSSPLCAKPMTLAPEPNALQPKHSVTEPVNSKSIHRPTQVMITKSARSPTKLVIAKPAPSPTQSTMSKAKRNSVEPPTSCSSWSTPEPIISPTRSSMPGPLTSHPVFPLISRARPKIEIEEIDRITPLAHVSTCPPTPTLDRKTFTSKSTFSPQSSLSRNSTISRHSAFISVASDDSSSSSSNGHSDEKQSRSFSRQSDYERDFKPQTAFDRALTKMENAASRIVTARLSEDWGVLDDNESYQEVLFEKRLWALSAYQRLTQNKQLQTPAHDLITNSRPEDQRRILHLYGSLADGWILASRYPNATVYTISSNAAFTAPTSYPAPLNHHILYVPILSAPMPFPENYFDAIVSRSVCTVLPSDEWTCFFHDYARILKPGGQIEVVSVDSHMSNEGPELASWVNSRIIRPLNAHGLSHAPFDTLIDTMECIGLESIKRARIALPATVSTSKPARSAPSTPMMPTFNYTQDPEQTKMMTYLGRHFYQDMYGRMLQCSVGEEFFWMDRGIRAECERLATKIVLTVACARKPVSRS